jgi:transposase
VFLDESGFMLQPLLRRTWAPQGQTPISHSWDRHDRLSVLSGLTVSPRHRHLRLFFAVHEENIRTPHVLEFLSHLRRHLRCPAILIWDRWNVHRSAARCMAETHPDWFDIQWLPAYAPDLNPVEHVWNHTKYGDLANFLADDLWHLNVALHRSLIEKERDQFDLHSCFRGAKLSM